jgi:hypothetical protein
MNAVPRKIRNLSLCYFFTGPEISDDSPARSYVIGLVRNPSFLSPTCGHSRHLASWLPVARTWPPGVPRRRERVVQVAPQSGDLLPCPTWSPRAGSPSELSPRTPRRLPSGQGSPTCSTLRQCQQRQFF